MVVGVYPHERVGPQSIVLDIRLTVDISKAAQSDLLADAVDYAAVAEAVQAFVVGREWMLIESLVHEIAVLIMSRFDVHSVQIDLKKMECVPNCESVTIRYSLDRR